VKIGGGPAAVTGDDRSIKATDCNPMNWEGAAIRMNRKSEDLPIQISARFPWTG
jgi:hypothetical protein